MSRPKGSKNKSTIEKETLRTQSNNIVNNNEAQKEFNTYQDYTQTVTEGFISKIFNDGIVKEVKAEDLVKWFASPDQYHQQIENVLQYYYISNGDVFQQFDLVKVLPTLNYKIEVYDKTKNYEKNVSLITKTLNKVKHKTLTRDILSQEITAGTLVGIWLGDKKNPYFHIFDNLEYIFPAYRKNGEWIAWLDLQWFKGMKEEERQAEFANLSPYVSESDYNKYLADSQGYRYIELPQERTVVLRTHTTSRNQRLGIPFAIQGLMDILHKKKLKDMEVAIANKVIHAVAILKLGNEKTPNPTKNQRQKVVAGAKKALTENEVTGTPVIAIPEWADIKFNEVKSDALDPSKFETINSDINSSLGTGESMKTGTGGNYASGKINFEVFYRKLAVLLEDIEQEVYGKLIRLIMPIYVGDDYSLVYDKESPISLEKKIDILMSLHSEGYAVKPIIDLLSGEDYQEFIDQSIYEIETLKLREKIVPPLTSYTITGDDTGGAPTNDDPTNDSTIRSKTSDGNSNPDASV
jgi:hypothetical protein